jgi:hypothetical protein
MNMVFNLILSKRYLKIHDKKVLETVDSQMNTNTRKNITKMSFCLNWCIYGWWSNPNLLTFPGLSTKNKCLLKITIVGSTKIVISTKINITVPERNIFHKSELVQPKEKEKVSSPCILQGRFILCDILLVPIRWEPTHIRWIEF